MENLPKNQKMLFELLKSTLTKKEIVSIIGEILGLKKSAAYGIIDGKSQISFDKMMMILEHSKVKLNLPFSEQSSDKSIWYSVSQKNDFRGLYFFRTIVSMLIKLSKSESKVYYTTYEIPFFLLLLFSGIACL